MLVSELATNCVLHARTFFEITVQEGDGQIRVEVSDKGTHFHTLEPQHPDSADPHGRGLIIVKALAYQWGSAPATERRGTTVWFTLRTSAGGRKSQRNESSSRLVRSTLRPA